MSQLNTRGDAVDLLGVQFLTDDLQIRQVCGGAFPTLAGRLSGCVIQTSDGAVVFAGGCNALSAAGAGVWAAWVLNGGAPGVIDSLGRWFPGSALSDPTEGSGASPDGAYAIKVARDSYGPWDVIERDGRRWRLTNGDAHNIQLLGGGEAIWIEAGDPSLHTTIGVSSLKMPQGGWAWPYAVNVGGVWTLLYQSESGGALVFGDRVLARGASFFRPVARQLASGVVRFRWTYDPGGGTPGGFDMTPAQLAALPVFSLAPPVPAPAPVPVSVPSPQPPALVPVAPHGAEPVTLTPFDLSAVQFIDSPADLATWPQTATITSVDFSKGFIAVDHTGRNSWPDLPFGDGSPGTVQYTLGLCAFVGGQWRASAVVQFWRGRELEAGGSADKVGLDWFYSERWGGLRGYQPQPGELVALFAGAGNLRDNDNVPPVGLRQRTDFALVRWGQNYARVAPAPVPIPGIPVPVPGTPDVAGALAAIQSQIAAMQSTIAALQAARPTEAAGTAILDGATIALRAHSNNKVVCSDLNKGPGGPLWADRDAVGGDWELFTIEVQP